ncbi:TMEM165/GDT1 family protein [soil metagenome]
MSSIELFGTVFGVIFVAELPDKTALAALVLASRNKPLPVFIGTGLGLTVQSVIAVAAGSLLAQLPIQYVQIGSGALFILCGALMWVRKQEDDHEEEEKAPAGFWRTLWMVFAVIVVAEFGDLTQIGTAAFQAKYHAWPIVLSASALALWCVAGVAVFVGNRAGKLLNPRVTQKVAAVIFTGIGLVLRIRSI